MINTIKENKWVITTSFICIILGVLTFFTFINKGFINLNETSLQLLLLFDLTLLVVFFIIIIKATYKIIIEKKEEKLGSQTSLRYIVFFTTTTLLPSILIALFSLFLFNTVLQTYFEKKIKDVINNSTEVSKYYVDQTRNSIEADILLMAIDINRKSSMFYDNPKRFKDMFATQRLLRKLDEIHLLDSSGNIILSNIVNESLNFVPPPEEAFSISLEGKPIRITDPNTNRSSGLVKLDNFIDTYLYIVKFLDPKVINYLRDTANLVSTYYIVQERKTGIKITFAIIYILIVSLLLFLSVIISINFSSRLTLPIINLINASDKISSGDLNTKVPKIKTDSEFEKLNENFNLMIERLKKQQDKLLLSERYEAWESVARKLAHEIKNPLTPIQLSIDRIKEKYLNKVGKDDENLSNYLNTITRQIKEIEHLVNEFSDFARMPKPILVKTNLTNAITRAFSLYEMSEQNIQFKFNKKKSNYFIKGDEEQLNRVFVNLIKNSIESINEKINKNTGFKGKINIEINEDSDYIYVIVLDDGLGFKQIDIKKMLKPYFTTKKNGTGLGLAIVTKIINDHNGAITFNSTDNGAKVEISIPTYDS